MPLTVAAVIAAGALGAAGVSAGTVPWDEAIGNVTGNGHAVSRTPAGQAGSSVVDSVIAMKSRAAVADPWRPQPQAGDVRPGSRDVSAADAITVPTALSASHGASAGRSSAAAGNSAQHGTHTRAAAASAAGAHTRTAHANAARGRAVRARTAARTAQARPAKAQAARPRRVRTQAAPAKPYLIYDSVTPSAIPAHRRVATYVNGAYAASAAAVAGHGPVLWIDTNGSDPAASALDVEPGDATPTGAAQWVNQKLTAEPHSLAIIYTMQSEWQQVKDSVAGLPGWMQSRVRYWIADPTGVPHVVPGSDATQWYWGHSYDITTASPGFQNH